MERGPLPPHERTWRHPSELAAEERATARAQAAAPSTRVFALSTGTLGLLAVGVLILTITPRRQDAPIAISATTTPAVSAAVQVEPGGAGPNSTFASQAAPANPGFAARGSSVIESVAVQLALATPIGDGHVAVITGDALAGHDAHRVRVRLPSGRVGVGQVMKKSGDAWLIELHEAEAGHDIADERPVGSEIVTVMDTPPVTIALADIDTLDIDEGIAVLDGDGDLVGICTRRRGDGKVRLIEVSAELAGATSADP